MFLICRPFILFSLIVILSAGLWSCKSVKPCGESYTETKQLFQSKKFREAKNNMDSLCLLTTDLRDTLADKNEVIGQITDENEKLDKELEAQRQQYDNLRKVANDSVSLLMSEINAREKALAEKSEDLARLQAAMEANQRWLKSFTENLKQALLAYPDKFNVHIKDGKVYITMANQLLFAEASDEIGKEGKKALNQLSGVLIENKTIDLVIEGHTDSIPIHTSEFRDNWELSAGRANAVSRELISNGIDPQRLTSSARADYDPVATNATKEGRAFNRRTEIIISPDLSELYTLIEPVDGEESLNKEQDKTNPAMDRK